MSVYAYAFLFSAVGDRPMVTKDVRVSVVACLSHFFFFVFSHSYYRFTPSISLTLLCLIIYFLLSSSPSLSLHLLSHPLLFFSLPTPLQPSPSSNGGVVETKQRTTNLHQLHRTTPPYPSPKKRNKKSNNTYNQKTHCNKVFLSAKV